MKTRENMVQSGASRKHSPAAVLRADVEGCEERPKRYFVNICDMNGWFFGAVKRTGQNTRISEAVITKTPEKPEEQSREADCSLGLRRCFSTEMLSTNGRTRQLNGTCASSVDMELFLHYSLIPSLFIILVLSFLQRREQHRQRGDTCYLLGNHFGIIIPLDFMGTFRNRWSYGMAFGATANKVMFLFSEGYQPLQVPQWAQAFVLLIGGIEVGLSHFPFFACLSSEFQLVSSILGFSYSLIWFAVTVHHITQCPHGQFVGRYETIMFYWPSLLCLAFLLGRFLHMFVKSLRVYLGWELPTEEKPLLEVHQAKHVKKLLRKSPRQEKKKSWFQTRIYEWDPCFHFPSRMIGTTVLAFICLYLVSRSE
ncbi:stimulated by retinoic acid gene 6 protein-like [Equus quagga]|uniref:stimulated by retinoic acid gene 6 protein-like n=1 Tax=Equus quagga TaxID=89248 RepID=UPI001EE21C81|nr:stimulated by retinoic acid gene 6 protein-like [Equus quagga]